MKISDDEELEDDFDDELSLSDLIGDNVKLKPKEYEQFVFEMDQSRVKA